MNLEEAQRRFPTRTVITPPQYSGQIDDGRFVVVGHVEPRTQVHGFSDERKVYDVADAENAGLICVRLPPHRQSLVMVLGARDDWRGYCFKVWRAHENVTVHARTEYFDALIHVTLADLVEELTKERVRALEEAGRAASRCEMMAPFAKGRTTGDA